MWDVLHCSSQRSLPALSRQGVGLVVEALIDFLRSCFLFVNLCIDSPPSAAKTAITFAVESDLPHISGQSTITVKGAPDETVVDYELVFHPRLGGTYSGAIHFVDPATGRYQWCVPRVCTVPVVACCWGSWAVFVVKENAGAVEV